jgi:hypothetical protein
MPVDDELRQRVLALAAEKLPGFDATDATVEFHNTMPNQGACALEELGFVDGCIVYALKKAGKLSALIAVVGSYWYAGEICGAFLCPGKVPSAIKVTANVREGVIEGGQTLFREATDPANYAPAPKFLVHKEGTEQTSGAELREAAEDFNPIRATKSILFGTTSASNSTIQNAFPVSAPESGSSGLPPVRRTPQPVNVGVVVVDSPPPSGTTTTTTTTPGPYIISSPPPPPLLS